MTKRKDPADLVDRRLIVPDDDTLSKIKGMAQIFCTQEEAAFVLGVGLSTFEGFLRNEPAARMAWDQGSAVAKMSLRRQQWVHAQKNAVMAIFLGKQYLGQRDMVENVPPPEKPPGGPDLKRLSVGELKELARMVSAAEGRDTGAGDGDPMDNGRDPPGARGTESRGIH